MWYIGTPYCADADDKGVIQIVLNEILDVFCLTVRDRSMSHGKFNVPQSWMCLRPYDRCAHTWTT